MSSGFLGRDVNKNCTYTMLHNEKCTSISREDVLRDLGVMFDEKLNFREHIHCKIIWHIKWLD